jgi:hypothetical protein
VSSKGRGFVHDSTEWKDYVNLWKDCVGAWFQDEIPKLYGETVHPDAYAVGEFHERIRQANEIVTL